jgi:hypothetical protein
MTTMGSNGERSGGTRTGLNKSVPTFTIPRTAAIVMTQATRTRIHDLQSSGSFVSDILSVLRPVKTVTAVKSPDLLNNVSRLLIAILHQSVPASITFNHRISATLHQFKHNLNSHRLYYLATTFNPRWPLTLPPQAITSRRRM